MSSLVIKGDRVPVRDRGGKTLYHVTAEMAETLIAAGTVRPVGRKDVTRVLLINSPEACAKIIHRATYSGQRYSHKRETTDNIAGVWAHRKLLSGRSSFLEVVSGCTKQ